MSGKLRFYTIPPTRIRWPYLLLNMNNFEREFRRVWHDQVRHCIVDSAVDKWFFLSKMNDYPKEYLSTYGGNAWMLSRRPELLGKVWVTIPDYPDDYESGMCWRDGKDNVELTFENIECYHKIEGVTWIYPIQSRFLDYGSLLDSCKRLKDEYNPKIVGIGTVCKTNNLKFIKKCVRTVRDTFKDTWVHAFGPTLKSIKYIWPYIDSFDSTAYFFKPNRKLQGQRMCRTQKERRRYFDYWVKKLNSILDIPTLFDFVDSNTTIKKEVLT